MNKIKLGDIAVSQTGPFGSQLHEEDYVLEGTPIVTVEHLGDVGFTTQNLPYVSDADAERLSKYTLQEGDIVFSRVGSIDRSVYTQKEQEGWLFSGRCIRVRCDKDKVNPRYLSYYFKLPEFKKMMLNISVGATMPSLNTKLMDGLELFLLNRNQQDDVASFFDLIDAKVGNNNKINKELNDIIQVTFQYWFLQYEFPNENGKPYCKNSGQMVWNEDVKKMIPAGWSVGELGDFGELIMGQSPKSDSYNEKQMGYPLINGAAELQEESVQISKYTTEPTRLCKKNDLLFCIRATIGNLQFAEEEYCLGRGVAAFRVFNSNSVEYIHQSLFYILELYKKILTGSIIVGISKDDLKEKKIVIPSKDVLERFSNIVRPMYDRIRKNKKENESLIELRNFMLPLLMNGQAVIKK